MVHVYFAPGGTDAGITPTLGLPRPVWTQHVNFLGRYIFENVKISTEDGLRQLETKV